MPDINVVSGESMRAFTRRRQRFVAAVALGLCVLTACTGDKNTPIAPPGESMSADNAGAAIIDKFAVAWSKSDRPDFRGIVDDPGIASTDIAAHVAELAVTSTSVRPIDDIDCEGDSCREHATVTHELDGAEEWTYETLIKARLNQGQWLVDWSAGTFHPDLTEVTTLVANRKLATRAPILDRNGKALTPERAIVRIGVVPEKVRRETYVELREMLAIDTPSLKDRVGAAEPKWFVPVIDLRNSDYAPLRVDLLKVPGIAIDTGSRALAPTSAWGRAILGSVGPATEDGLQNAGPLTIPSDEIGLTGLQYAYQERLAGTPGITIDLVEKASEKSVLNQVLVRRPEAGEPLETTLDIDAQTAAEQAVSNASDTTSLVVVKASTGELLAAANAPGPTSYNTAFIGRYAPGSTFKIVTAAELLGAGIVTPRTPIRCPDSTVVGGKRFKNYDEGIISGRADFSDAFAASCNTTIVSYADQTTGKELSRTAEMFGFGADWELGIDGFSGSVPADSDLVTRAADMIGQGTVLASPLAMAMVAAAVDSGVTRTPTLLPGQQPGERLRELDPAVVSQLQTMMRKVVTTGTGRSINLPGTPVYAKTGTAEYAKGKGTGTNAWMVGYRGDIAFAVLVENGRSGSEDASPVVSSLLTHLPPRLYQ